MSQRVVRHEVREVISFSRFRSQKLSARGNIEKEIPHADRRAARMSSVFNVAHASALDGDARGCVCALDTGRQLNFGNGGDRRERFTAKSECADRGEIVCLANLRGGV